jgi:hypothetical protein
VAADAVCAAMMAGQLRTERGARQREILAGRRGVTGPAAIDAVVEDEIASVRAYGLDVVTGALEPWADHAAADRFLDERAEAVRRDPSHPLRAAIVAPLGSLLGRLRASRDEYLGFVRSGTAR